jgi:hypothetical protein
VREPHQVAVGRRGVDDDEVVGVLDGGDGLGEVGELDRLVVLDLGTLGARNVIVRGDFQRQAGPFGPGPPVLHVVGEALLPAVEVDRGDALAGLQQSDHDMHARGRLARSPLFVAEHDDVRGPGVSDRRLEQHDTKSPG